MSSVKEVIYQHLHTKVLIKRVLGPSNPVHFPQVHTCQFEVIHNSTLVKWRLIVDMSSPAAVSVNNSVNESLCYLFCMIITDGVMGAMEVPILLEWFLE